MTLSDMVAPDAVTPDAITPGAIASVAAAPERAVAGRHSAHAMHRLILGYAPATLVPAAVSMCSIYAFTRLLGTQQFGAFNLAFSVIMVAQSVLFFPTDLAVSRFYPAAQTHGGTAAFLRTMYTLVLAIGLFAVLAAAAAALLLERGTIDRELADTAWLILPLLLLRALVSTNQTVNRAAGRMLRFNVVECLHAVIGLAAGLAAVILGVRSGGAVMAGLLVGAAVAAAIDLRRLGSLRLSRLRLGLRLRLGVRVGVGVDRAILAEVLWFAWPLVLSFVVSCSLQYADRFLVSTYGGTAALAVYVVAFSLVDRPISLICLSITAGTFQKAVDTYVRDGAEAGRRQAGRNGAVLLGLALPACVGLILTRHSVADILVGASFRDGVALLIPIMALTALLRGVGAHYIDHAFHLANRSFRLFLVYTPSALANIVLSVLLVPRYGMVAAAYGALACQAAAVLVGWLAARRVLPLWLPGGEILRICVCLVVMTGALLAVPLPVGWAGLIGGTAIGVAAYLGTAIAVDLGGLRRLLRRRKPVGTTPACPS